MVRTWLAVVAIGVATAGPGAVFAQEEPAFTVPPVALEILAEGLPPLTSPVSAGDDRLFLPLLDGRILIFENGAVRPEPFLDIRSQVRSVDEAGFLSVAFHPRYTENGLFFVYYVDTSARPVVSRFRVADDGATADPSSETVLLHLDQPFPSHFGGQLQFGPDGYLYAGVGDAGDRFDPLCNAQRLDDLHGKILRLDVDSGAAVEPFYSVPPTNPFVTRDGARAEIWALGLRNPWRFTFDRATGDLYIGDVGERSREEIDFQPAASGGGENYGWARQEGNLCIDRVESCPMPVPACGDAALVAPILDYPASDLTCNAVISGFVYRGAAIPALQGTYLYGDYCTGTMRAARRDDEGEWSSQPLGTTLVPLTGFGEDRDGEIYVASRHGVLARLVVAPPPPPPPSRCSRDESTLCLAASRFLVEVRYIEPGSESRRARAVPLTDDTGYFWFFDRGNVELMAKVIDGCDTPLGAYWVFAAGLTNVDVTLTVTDSATGAVRRYHNPAGHPFPPVQDTAAFPCR